MNDIATKDNNMTDFMETLRKKLRKDIGTLMPPEVIDGMIKQVINDEFFKERRTVERYGPDKVAPSAFVELVVNESTQLIEQVARQWMVDNQALVQQQLDLILKEGIGKFVIKAFEKVITESLDTREWSLIDRIKQGIV